ncbi:MAG: hypothetical protein AB8B80_16185 [Marinicellaceae bacterium]
MIKKIIMFMLCISSTINAAPHSVFKTSYTEFYDKDVFLFSIIQEWQFVGSTGEPTPLPMVTREYIYAENTGLEHIYTKTNGKTVFEDTNWLKESKWLEFTTVNKIPVELYVHKNASVIVRSDIEASNESAWFLNSENAWCEFNQDKCQPKEYVFEFDYEIEIPCIDFDAWWCPFMKVTDYEPYWEEVYVNNAVADAQSAAKVFTTKIDLTRRTIATGKDESGVLPHFMMN